MFPEDGMRRVPVERLEVFCAQVCRGFGLSDPQARALADSLVFAQCRGVTSHGLMRLEHYMARVEKGLINLSADMPFTMESGALACLDAENGLGQLAGRKATRKAMELAGRWGLGQVSVANSNHFGTGAWFSLPAARAGFAALNLSNASPAMAPYGAAQPLLGTNPVSLALPRGPGKEPLVLDMALSAVSRGKIRVFAAAGEKIPSTWGLNAQGEPTEDPREVLEGSLCPIGGAKGSGLAFLVDLLCGTLTGTGLTGDTRNILSSQGPSRTGHLFLCMDVARFLPVAEFGRRVDQCVGRMKALDPVAPGGEVLAPGEPELRQMEQCRREGVPLPDALCRTLDRLAQRAGCPAL